MEKAIAHPPASALMERSRLQFVKAERQSKLHLRQNYKREAPKLVRQIGSHAHAKQ
jgi:hypothetical protein